MFSLIAGLTHSRGKWEDAETDYLLTKQEAESALDIIQHEKLDLEAWGRLLTGKLSAEEREEEAA